ncbi:hypothetical protein [Streptomyces atratus]|uniref:hypothetical protein n=1 Tax=Streptomyces atratus TaxID=1893 RepID=UPI00364ACD13
MGASVADELHAFLDSAKRVEIEHRVEEQVLKDDALDGAPPRMGGGPGRRDGGGPAES